MSTPASRTSKNRTPEDIEREILTFITQQLKAAKDIKNSLQIKMFSQIFTQFDSAIARTFSQEISLRTFSETDNNDRKAAFSIKITSLIAMCGDKAIFSNEPASRQKIISLIKEFSKSALGTTESPKQKPKEMMRNQKIRKQIKNIFKAINDKAKNTQAVAEIDSNIAAVEELLTSADEKEAREESKIQADTKTTLDESMSNTDKDQITSIADLSNTSRVEPTSDEKNRVEGTTINTVEETKAQAETKTQTELMTEREVTIREIFDTLSLAFTPSTNDVRTRAKDVGVEFFLSRIENLQDSHDLLDSTITLSLPGGNLNSNDLQKQIKTIDDKTNELIVEYSINERNAFLSLQNEHDTAQENNRILEKDLERLNDRARRLTANLAEVSDNASTHSAETQRQIELSNNQHMEINYLKEKLKESERALSSVTAKLKKHEKTYGKDLKAIRDATSELFEQELVEHEAEIGKLTAEKQEALLIAEEATNEIVYALERATQAESNLAQSSNETKRLSEALEQTKQTLASATGEDEKNKFEIKQLQESLTTLQQTATENSQTNSELLQKINQLNQEAKTASEWSATRILSLTEKLQQSEQNKADALQAASEQGKLISQAQTENRELSHRLVQSKDELNAAGLRDEKNKSEIKVLQESVISLRNSNNESQTRIVTLSRNLEEVQAEKAETGQKLENSELERKRLSELLDSTKRELAAAVVQKDDAFAKLAELQTQNKKLRDELENLTEKHKTDLEGVKNELNDAMLNSEADLKAAQQKIEQLTATNQQLNNERQEDSEKIKELSSKLAENEQKRRELEAKITSIETELKKTVDELTRLSEKNNQDQKTYEDNIAALNSKLDGLKTDLQSSTEKISELEDENGELSQQLELSEEERNNEVKTLTEQLKTIELKAEQDKKAAAEDAKRAEERAQRKIDELSVQLITVAENAAEEASEAIQEQLKQLNEQLQQAEQQQKLASDQAEANATLLASKDAEIKSLKDSLATSEANLESLKAEEQNEPDDHLRRESISNWSEISDLDVNQDNNDQEEDQSQALRIELAQLKAQYHAEVQQLRNENAVLKQNISQLQESERKRRTPNVPTQNGLTQNGPRKPAPKRPDIPDINNIDTLSRSRTTSPVPQFSSIVPKTVPTTPNEPPKTTPLNNAQVNNSQARVSPMILSTKLTPKITFDVNPDPSQAAKHQPTPNQPTAHSDGTPLPTVSIPTPTEPSITAELSTDAYTPKQSNPSTTLLYSSLTRRAQKIGRKEKQFSHLTPSYENASWIKLIEKSNNHIEKLSKLHSELNDETFKKKYIAEKPGGKYTSEQRLDNLRDKAEIYKDWKIGGIQGAKETSTSFQLMKKSELSATSSNAGETFIPMATVARDPAKKKIDIIAETIHPDDKTIFMMIEQADYLARFNGKRNINISNCESVPEVAIKMITFAEAMNLVPKLDETNRNAVFDYLELHPDLKTTPYLKSLTKTSARPSL